VLFGGLHIISQKKRTQIGPKNEKSTTLKRKLTKDLNEKKKKGKSKSQQVGRQVSVFAGYCIIDWFYDITYVLHIQLEP
jgi:hypothetical protein